MNAPHIVVRSGGLGDLILLYPMLEELYRRHNSPLTLITGNPLAETVYRHCPYINEVLLMNRRRLPNWLNPSLRKINQLATQPVASIYNIDQKSSRANTLQKLENQADLTFASINYPGRGKYEHESDYGLRLISNSPDTVRITNPEFPRHISPVLPVTVEELEACTSWLDDSGIHTKKIVLLQPGNKKTTKRGSASRTSNKKYWSEENWAQVIDHILDQGNTTVLLCGAPSEYEWLDSIKSLCLNQNSLKNVAHDLPIRRLMALASNERSYYVGVDTGPAHLTAAMGCPACIFYGPSSMTNYLPLSWGQLIIPLEKMDTDTGSNTKRITPDISLITKEEAQSAIVQLISEAQRTRPSELTLTNEEHHDTVNF